MEEPPSTAAETEPRDSYSLKGKPAALTLEAEGLHHPGNSRRGRLVYTRYADITHLASSQRSLWLGTKRSVYPIARRAFVDENAPENLVRTLLARISSQPEGSAQLARMAQIEETARLPGEARCTRVLLFVCAVAYALQVFGGEAVHAVGHFRPVLFFDGDWWRIVTGNVLHAFALHLILNLLALLALGTLVERAVGTARTGVVMIASGIGAMLASAAATDVAVVGVSGVVSGLFGALVWLELRFAEVLPAWWRVPRRTLVWVFAVSVLLSLLPFVAGAAHAGGFLAGAGVAALQSWNGLRSRPSPSTLRALAAAGATFCALAGVAAVWELWRSDDYLARYAVRMTEFEEVSAEELNNLAWVIAIDDGSSPEMLQTALGLAERAVDESEGQKPEFLDTLAELHFQLGDAAAALRVIDEAIRQAPDRDYYREQRKRFTGEREGGPPTEFFPNLLPDWGEKEEVDEGIRV